MKACLAVSVQVNLAATTVSSDTTFICLRGNMLKFLCSTARDKNIQKHKTSTNIQVYYQRFTIKNISRKAKRFPALCSLSGLLMKQ